MHDRPAIGADKSQNCKQPKTQLNKKSENLSEWLHLVLPNACGQTRRGAAPELSVVLWIGLFFIGR